MDMLSRAPRAPGLLLLTLLIGCSSSTPPPEHPAGETPSESPAGGATPSETSDPGSDPAPGGDQPKKKSNKDAVPDDYELTNRDCDDLGKQFANVIRADEASKLSPKLKDKQREAALGSIDKAAVQRQDQWIEGCQKSLVGKTVDAQTLKCAMAAKSVKEFDACLNGPPPEKK